MDGAGGSSRFPDGLYAKPQGRLRRLHTITVILFMYLLAAFVTAVVVVVFVDDEIQREPAPPGTEVTIAILGGLLVILCAWAIQLFSWKRALQRRKAPFLEFDRGPEGLVLKPARYWGLARGRSRASAPRPGEAGLGPLVIGPGDAVVLSHEIRWYTMLNLGDRLYALSLETPRGRFRSIVPLGVGALDLEPFARALVEAGATISVGKLSA